MIWLVVTTLAPVSSTVEVSSSTRWVARGPGRHTSRISRVLSSYSRDQKVRSGGVGSLCGVKVAWAGLCSQNHSEPRVRLSSPGSGSPWLGAGLTLATPTTGRRSAPGKVRVRGGVPGGAVVEWTSTWLRLVPRYTWPGAWGPAQAHAHTSASVVHLTTSEQLTMLVTRTTRSWPQLSSSSGVTGWKARSRTTSLPRPTKLPSFWSSKLNLRAPKPGKSGLAEGWEMTTMPWYSETASTRQQRSLSWLGRHTSCLFTSRNLTCLPGPGGGAASRLPASAGWAGRSPSRSLYLLQ